jgi:cytochrome c oxidase assembly protein subunit 15
MRAGLLHPHVFLFIEPQKFWSSISALHEAKVEHFIDYEPTRFVKAVVQLVHRLTAWGIVIFVLWFSNKAMKSSLWPKMKFPVLLVSGVVLMQVLLGILTVINSQWRIPVVWGSVHQAGAFILLAAIIYLHFTVSAPPSDSKNSNN